MIRRLLCTAALLPVFAGAIGCQAPQPTLYERIGGRKTLECVIDDFLDRLSKDKDVMNPAVKKRLEAIHVPSLRKHFLDFAGQAAGGPEKYKGRSMEDSHAGLKITQKEFDLSIDLIAKSFDKCGVKEKEKQEFLAALRAQAKDIVGK